MTSSRILKNTLILYARQLLIVLINLYAIRVVLNSLGIQDFGVFTVVAGTVALASFLPGTLALATQRYFSFALGKGEHESAGRIYTTSIVIYGAAAIISIAGLETIGVWFVTSKLNIPVESRDSVELLLQCAIFTFISGIFSAVYVSILVAYEKFVLYAYISLLEAGLRLIAALLIQVSPWDGLVTYGATLLVASVFSATVYGVMCYRQFPSIRIRAKYFDRNLFIQLVTFTGWTFYGQLAAVARNQVITVMLNQAFNPTVAAARAISLAISTQITLFANNFNTSLHSPIIKHYASGEHDELFQLLNWGSKMSFFLMWLVALPLYLLMEQVLLIWLTTPPVEATLFARLALLESVIIALSLPLATAARAPGEMALYEFSLGTIQILIPVAAWIALSNNYGAESAYYIVIFATLLMFAVRIFILKSLIQLPVTRYFTQAVIPCLVVAVLSGFPSYYLVRNLSDTLFGLVGGTLAIGAITMAVIYTVGMDSRSRILLRNALSEKLKKFRS